MAADVWRWCPVHQKWLQDVNAKITKAGLARAREPSGANVTSHSGGGSPCSSRPDCLERRAQRPSGSAAAVGRWRDNGSTMDPFPPPPCSTALKKLRARPQGEEPCTPAVSTPAALRPPLGGAALGAGIGLGTNDPYAEPKDALTLFDVPASTPLQVQSSSTKPSKWLFETPLQGRKPPKPPVDGNIYGSFSPMQAGAAENSYRTSPHLRNNESKEGEMPAENSFQVVPTGSLVGAATLDENWVTVFGSQPAVREHGGDLFRMGQDELSMVMQEFGKCGRIIVREVGPKGSNWVHLHYENRHDTGMALMKNGLQLAPGTTVTVRTLDKRQRQQLLEETNRKLQGRPPSNTGTNVQADESASKNGDADADAPPKSSISRFVDLVFDCERDYQISAAGFVIPIKFEPGLYKELFTPQIHRCDAFATPYCDPAAAVPLYYEYPRARTEPCAFARSGLGALRASSSISTGNSEEEVAGPSADPMFSAGARKGGGIAKRMTDDEELATIEALRILRSKVINLSVPCRPEDGNYAREMQGRDGFRARPLPPDRMPLYAHQASVGRRQQQGGRMPSSSQMLWTEESGMSGPTVLRNEPGGEADASPSRRPRRHRASRVVTDLRDQSLHRPSCPKSQESSNDQPEKVHACPILQVVRGEGPLSTNFTNRQKLQARRHKPTCIYSHGDKRGRRHRPACAPDSSSPGSKTESYQSCYQGVPTREREREPSAQYAASR